MASPDATVDPWAGTVAALDDGIEEGETAEADTDGAEKDGAEKDGARDDPALVAVVTEDAVPAEPVADDNPPTAPAPAPEHPATPVTKRPRPAPRRARRETAIGTIRNPTWLRVWAASTD